MSFVNLYTFNFFHKAISQLQPNLTQSIRKGFQVCSNEGLEKNVENNVEVSYCLEVP